MQAHRVVLADGRTYTVFGVDQCSTLIHIALQCKAFPGIFPAPFREFDVIGQFPGRWHTHKMIARGDTGELVHTIVERARGSGRPCAGRFNVFMSERE